MANKSYAEIHNKLVRRYRRHSLWVVWLIAFSCLCLIIYLPTTDLYDIKKYLMDTESTFNGNIGFGFGGITNISSLFSVIYFTFYDNLNIVCNGFISMLSIINILILGVFIYLAYLAYKGNKKPLIVGLVFNIVDFCLFPFFFIPQLNGLFWQGTVNIIINVCLHCISIFFIALALYDRSEIIKLKIKHDSYINNEVVNKKDRKVITFVKKDDSNKKY